MTYVVLLVELLAVLPMASILRGSPRYMPWAWFALGVLMFMYSGYGWLGISLISWPFFPGHTKGMEVTIVDILALALLIAQGRDKSRPKPPFRFVMAAYFLAAAASILVASVPMAAGFYCWQLLRMYLLYLAVYRASSNQRYIDSLLRGMALGLVIELGFVTYQIFIQGIAGPPGTFGHRNALGLVSNLVMLPLLSLLLSSRSSRLIGLGTLSGIATAALLASRATAGLAGIGSVLVYALSVMRSPSKRKTRFGLLGLGVALIMVPIAVNTLNERVEAQGGSFGDTEYDERAHFIRAASLMLEDHPLGIGANHFTIVANTGGYYNEAGVAPTYGSRSAHVHNIYWLTLAELGYFGFVTLILALGVPLFTALRYAWRYRRQPESDLLGGLGIAILILSVQSYFEWVLVTAASQYFLVSMWGITAGLSKRLETAKVPTPAMAATPPQIVTMPKRRIRR